MRDIPTAFVNHVSSASHQIFSKGSAAAHLGNRSKHFKPYTKFWQLLGDVGLWYHPEYLVRKGAVTERDDPREIMPECVITVIKQYYYI